MNGGRKQGQALGLGVTRSRRGYGFSTSVTLRVSTWVTLSGYALERSNTHGRDQSIRDAGGQWPLYVDGVVS